MRKLKLLVPLGDDRFEVPSPALLRAAEQVVALGIPMHAALVLVERISRDCDSISRDFTKLFLRELWQPFEEAGQPDEGWDELIEGVDSLRPLASEALLALFKLRMTTQLRRPSARSSSTRPSASSAAAAAGEPRPAGAPSCAPAFHGRRDVRVWCRRTGPPPLGLMPYCSFDTPPTVFGVSTVGAALPSTVRLAAMVLFCTVVHGAIALHFGRACNSVGNDADAVVVCVDGGGFDVRAGAAATVSDRHRARASLHFDSACACATDANHASFDGGDHLCARPSPSSEPPSCTSIALATAV